MEIKLYSSVKAIWQLSYTGFRVLIVGILGIMYGNLAKLSPINIPRIMGLDT